MKINLTKLLNIKRRVDFGYNEDQTTDASQVDGDKTYDTSPERPYSFIIETDEGLRTI